ARRAEAFGFGCFIFACLASAACSLASSLPTSESLASALPCRAVATSSRQALASLSTRVGRLVSREKLTAQTAQLHSRSCLPLPCCPCRQPRCRSPRLWYCLPLEKVAEWSA